MLASVAFLEAVINEVFWASKNLPQRMKQLDPDARGSLAIFWDQDLKRVATLNKYQMTLAVARLPAFKKRGLLYQDVCSVTKRRNALVYFEPGWETDKPTSLENRLKRKFSLSPLFGEGSLFFPNRCLSHDCAKWALAASLDFTDEFFSRMGLDPFYDRASLQNYIQRGLADRTKGLN